MYFLSLVFFFWPGVYSSVLFVCVSFGWIVFTGGGGQFYIILFNYEGKILVGGWGWPILCSFILIRKGKFWSGVVLGG